MVFLKNKRLGRQTVAFTNPPSIAAGSCVVGQKEGEGPLRKWFDYISDDSYFGQSSWEKAESVMLSKCFALCCDKARIPPSDIQYLFAGDLLNQCAGSTFAARDLPIPYFGVYGACSTMAESLSLAAMTIDGGYADTVCAMTSSHFCSAERQFRLPLEYGGQRTPTAQWTVTGAGALLLTSEGEGPYVTHVTTGRIRDAGVTDANNMGAAMAPAAYETLRAHFADTGRTPADYAAIITGRSRKDRARNFDRSLSPGRRGSRRMLHGLRHAHFQSGDAGRARRRQRLRVQRVGALRAHSPAHDLR